MTHPTREEWMSYLYDESPAESRTALQAHLRDCADCRKQFATWQGAARTMSEWQMPRRRVSRRPALVRWAIAAAVVALAFVGGARLLDLEKEVRGFRAEVREQNAALTQVAEQNLKSANAEAQALMAAVVERLEEKRLQDQKTMLLALQQLSAQRISDYAKLRKELETVAVFSEAGLQRAESQISSLAYAPANYSNEK